MKVLDGGSHCMGSMGLGIVMLQKGHLYSDVCIVGFDCGSMMFPEKICIHCTGDSVLHWHMVL